MLGRFKPILDLPVPASITLRVQTGDYPYLSLSQLVNFDMFENEVRFVLLAILISILFASSRFIYLCCCARKRISAAMSVLWNLLLPISGYARIAKRVVKMLCRIPLFRSMINIYVTRLVVPLLKHTSGTCLLIILCVDRSYGDSYGDLMPCSYEIALVVSDGSDQVEFILRGNKGDQLIGMTASRIITRNWPYKINSFLAAEKIKYPPPEFKAILSSRFRFVVAVREESFYKPQPSFEVTAIERE